MQKEREQNLMVVAALDRFAEQEGLSLHDSVRIFRQYGIFDLLRDNYEALHTQGLYEGANFASDYIARASQ